MKTNGKWEDGFNREGETKCGGGELDQNFGMNEEA